MQTISISGRELPMAFDVRAWICEIETKFGSLAEMTSRLSGQKQPITAGIDMLQIVINAGIRRTGGGDKITRDWLMDNLQPAEVVRSIRLGQQVIMESFAQTEASDAQDEPVDEVLAALEKKDTGRA